MENTNVLKPCPPDVEAVARAICQLNIERTDESWRRYRLPESWRQFIPEAERAVAARTTITDKEVVSVLAVDGSIARAAKRGQGTRLTPEQVVALNTLLSHLSRDTDRG